MYKFSQEDYADLYSARKAINFTQSGASLAKCPPLEARRQSWYHSYNFTILLFLPSTLSVLNTSAFVFLCHSSYHSFCKHSTTPNPSAVHYISTALNLFCFSWVTNTHRLYVCVVFVVFQQSDQYQKSERLLSFCRFFCLFTETIEISVAVAQADRRLFSPPMQQFIRQGSICEICCGRSGAATRFGIQLSVTVPSIPRAHPTPPLRSATGVTSQYIITIPEFISSFTSYWHKTNLS